MHRQETIKRVLAIFKRLTVLGAVLFLAAGNLYWIWGWVYLALCLLLLLINTFFMLCYNPELIEGRSKVIPKDTKAWDRAIMIIYSLMMILTLLLSGLDHRFQWTSHFSLSSKFVGIAIFIVGNSFASWAMITNSFFATTVRLQEEKNHHVISNGPYRIVRHPGYTGWTLSYLSTPLILNSYYSYIPSCLAIMILVIRTFMEDRFLKIKLEGYVEYSQYVKYRLIPYIW
jgi:protein-S-isoprenylcysteine O-methyltransferase Ste14